jgi:hypothetical protein
MTTFMTTARIAAAGMTATAAALMTTFMAATRVTAFMTAVGAMVQYAVNVIATAVDVVMGRAADRVARDRATR